MSSPLGSANGGEGDYDPYAQREEEAGDAGGSASKEKEDDDEDEAKEEEEEVSGPRRKKRKTRAGLSAFLDVEAEVDEEEEEEEEEAEEGLDNDFIVHRETSVGVADDRRHRDYDRMQHDLLDKSAQELAKEFRERYARRQGGGWESMGDAVPRNVLMPGVNDPSIFG
ncbi:hypothetical protein BT69DRAFT_1330649, partial [Atractiella rhizophila]